MPEDYTGFLAFATARGNSPASYLEAERWQLQKIGPGQLDVQCHLPECVLNSAGMLFGGFTPTYIDLIAIWASMTTLGGEAAWMVTVNMRVDYFEPIVPPGFRALARVLNIRKRDYFVETRFEDEQGTLLANGITTLRKITGIPSGVSPQAMSDDKE